VNDPILGDASYARLPEDLLAELLADTPAVTQQVIDLLAPALEEQARLREAAEDGEMILNSRESKTGTVCAVDGGFAVERTIAVDIAMAVAVGVEGFTTDQQPCAWEENQYASFHRVLLHDVDNERLVRAAAICHELQILVDAPHEVRIYDGSHLTPVIQFNSGTSSTSDRVNSTTVEVAEEVGMETALAAFIGDPRIVAMPKYDSSRELAKDLGKRIRRHIPGDDKFLTSLILRGGEYTRPMQVPSDPWRQLHIMTPAGSGADLTGKVPEFDDLLEPLRQRKMYFFYWRPDETAPSYRIEVKPELAADETSLNLVLSTLSHQVTAPFVREPYPQYLADVMAKSVGLGLSALQAAAHLALTRQQPQLAPMLVHSYRTEGI
jgi:hypothetical protein